MFIIQFPSFTFFSFAFFIFPFVFVQRNLASGRYVRPFHSFCTGLFEIKHSLQELQKKNFQKPFLLTSARASIELIINLLILNFICSSSHFFNITDFNLIRFTSADKFLLFYKMPNQFAGTNNPTMGEGNIENEAECYCKELIMVGIPFIQKFYYVFQALKDVMRDPDFFNNYLPGDPELKAKLFELFSDTEGLLPDDR